MNTTKDNRSWRLTSDLNKLKLTAHSLLKCEPSIQNCPRRRSVLWKMKPKQLMRCRIRRKLTIRIRIRDMHLIKLTPINIISSKRSSRCSEIKRFLLFFIRQEAYAIIAFSVSLVFGLAWRSMLLLMGIFSKLHF